MKKTVFIMAGLPARGKTFLSLRLERYLEWQGLSVRIFNAGSYRRRLLGMGSSRNDFFDPARKDFALKREEVAKRCFSDLVDWLRAGGEVAVYDATNITRRRRAYLAERCLAEGLDYIFVENICDDPVMLERIVDIKTRSSVDYRDRDPVEARRDFLIRMRHYESAYDPVNEGFPLIKIFNFGERVIKNLHDRSHLIEDAARFLGSIRLAEKDVYITRHGQTYYNLEDRIGGDSSLTEKGRAYAERLARRFRSRDLVVFTSEKRRTIETAEPLDRPGTVLAELNEINSGVCEGLSYREIASRFPDVYSKRKADKFNYRYPDGESYRDLIERVKGAIVKIEATRGDVLVIAHRAVNRCLFSYFIPTPRERIPYIDMPLGSVIRIFHRGALYDFETVTV